MIAKLPKLDLKKFDGNILKWTRFWDAFEATIHNNKNLHNISKFKLRGQIKGTADELLFELKLTKGSLRSCCQYSEGTVWKEAQYDCCPFRQNDESTNYNLHL